MDHKIASGQTILLVEDSDDDFEATELALTESNLTNPIVRCEDGQQALDFLFHQGKYETLKPPAPGIILLDLNLPGIDGRMVLNRIKSSVSLKDIPVVVLTTSSDDQDITACYTMGANTFVQKPVDLDKFIKAIKRLKEYWFEIAILPKQNL